MLRTIVCISAFVVGFAAHADEQLASAMCGYIKEDNRNQLRKLLSDNKINVRKVYDKVQCNGDSLIKFAMRSDAYETGSFFVKQMPAKALVAEDLETWATANGFAASPLINDIKARIGQD